MFDVLFVGWVQNRHASGSFGWYVMDQGKFVGKANFLSEFFVQECLQDLFGESTTFLVGGTVFCWTWQLQIKKRTFVTGADLAEVRAHDFQILILRPTAYL